MLCNCTKEKPLFRNFFVATKTISNLRTAVEYTFHPPTCLSNEPAPAIKTDYFSAPGNRERETHGYSYTQHQIRVEQWIPRLELADSSFISTWHAPRSHLAGSWGVNWNCGGDYTVDREFALLHNLILIIRIRGSVFAGIMTPSLSRGDNTAL